MKVLIFLAVLVLATAFEYAAEWEAWKSDHGKVYGSVEEELRRLNIWVSNNKYVELHNARAAKHGFTLAMNKFADLESAEFSGLFKGHQQISEAKVGKKAFVSLSKLPSSVDWRKEGYVTLVKDQGQCESCWAFSTTGSLEGQHFKATGKLVSFSEQNLVDCMSGYDCESGGSVGAAFEYIQTNKGIDTEESYPYQEQKADGKCRYNPADSGATLSDWEIIKSGSEGDLQGAVATVGPISVAIDASERSFQFYDSGVYYSTNCSSTNLDHDVLAVGYNATEQSSFWIVKNSWGTDWGMDGYISMSRNRNNNCGIATDALYPIV